MTADAAGPDHPIPAQPAPPSAEASPLHGRSGAEGTSTLVRATGVLADRMAAALVHREPGWRLPRRSALARRYNVSLVEIDAAIADLARRSLLRRLPDGQLYRASPADYWIPVEGAGGLGTRLDPMGSTITCQTRHVSRREAPQDVAWALGLPAATRIRVVRCVWSADGEPAALSTAYLHDPSADEGAEEDPEADTEPSSFGSVLTGLPAAAVSVEMSPPQPAVARSLRLAPGQPVITVTVRFADPAPGTASGLTVVVLKPELFRVEIDTTQASVSAPLPWQWGRGDRLRGTSRPGRPGWPVKGDMAVAAKFPARDGASGLRGPGRAGRLAIVALTSAGALALAACSGGAPSGSPPPASSSPAAAAVQTTPAGVPQTLSETGSSLMAPLFALWAPAYHSRFSQVTLKTASSSSGVGISSAAAGTADIGASDAYLSSASMTKYVTLVNIPLAVAALMVVYNVPQVGAATHLKLDGTVLARIFSGKITKWDDRAIQAINPGVSLPGIPIVLVHRADSSGSTFLFTSYLNAQDPADWGSSLIGTTVAWPRQPGEIGATGTGAVLSSLRATPGAIGYAGVSYLSKVTAASLGEAAVGNSSGRYVLPTAAAIDAALGSFTNTPAGEAISLINGSGAQAYPIINYEYAIVNSSQPNPTEARDLQAFLYWAITGGTAQLAPVNFQPLPSAIVTLSEAQIATIHG